MLLISRLLILSCYLQIQLEWSQHFGTPGLVLSPLKTSITRRHLNMNPLLHEIEPLHYSICKFFLAYCCVHKYHDNVIKWKFFPHYWFFLISDWINDWVNNHEAGDLRHHRAHYDVTVIYFGPTIAEYADETYDLIIRFRLQLVDLSGTLACRQLCFFLRKFFSAFETRLVPLALFTNMG